MRWETFEEHVVSLNNEREVAQVKEFLARFELAFDAMVDYTMALYRGEQIIATGSLAGEVLRNIAIDPSLQGEGLAAVVVGHLMREAGRRVVADS